MRPMKAKRYISRLLDGTLLVLLVSGCAMENGDVPSEIQSTISYDMVENDSRPAVTRSGVMETAAQKKFVMHDQSMSMEVAMSIDTAPFVSVTSTKGTLLEGASSLQSMTPTVDCYDGTASYFTGVTLSYADGKWAPSSDRLWKSTQTLAFYAVAGLPSGTGNSFTTAYDKATMACVIPTEASAQQDILLGYHKGGFATDPANKALATLRFSHPLAAVKFKVGTIEGFQSTDVIKSISLGGVYTSGTCVAIYANDGTPTFTWTPSSGTQTVSMSDNTSGLSVSDGIIGEPFILVPQSFSETAKLTVSMTLTVNGEEYTVSGELSSGAFQQGKVTTLTIGAVTKKEVKIEFTDEVVYDASNWPTKKSLVISNTGTANAFVRISLVGDWVNKNHKIISSWTENDPCGNFNGGTNGAALSSEYWTKGTDGFWYYKYYIKPGQTLKHPLFSTYKITTLPSVESIAYLDLNVNVQAVQADADKSTANAAWTSAIVSAAGITYTEDN